MRTQSQSSARTARRPPLDGEGGAAEQPYEQYRVTYDEYRVKLYKIACRNAREQREQLRLDWEQRDRERD
jgi:hypothetical protein